VRCVKRTPFADWPCPIARTVDLLGDWWTPLVLREAYYGVRRFDEMQRTLQIGRSVLTERLNRPVREALLERTLYQARPDRYELRPDRQGPRFPSRPPGHGRLGRPVAERETRPTDPAPPHRLWPPDGSEGRGRGLRRGARARLSDGVNRPGLPRACHRSIPELDVIDRLDPDYRPAYRKYAGGEPDAIGLAEWGLNKTFRLMLEAAGRDLSRQSFLRALTSG
jgi:DNA-binding HxlR family transcriptional regulator